MEILRGLESLPDPRLKNSWVTWGVFDGVHRGHQRVVQKLLSLSGENPSVLITFDRHPAEVLRGVPVPLVVSLEERLRLIDLLGVDFLLLLSFTKAFAETTAEDFIRSIVVEGLGASGILLGHDSHFGKGRKGDFGYLEQLGKDIGIPVESCQPKERDGRPMSSTLIRERVAGGEMQESAKLLGRPFCLQGVVVPGDRRGTELGFPTANLELGKTLVPPFGVYAVDAVVEGKTYRGAANLGSRPTFYEEGAKPLLEVHLLDYEGGDLYGRRMEVQFLRRIRDELKFDTVAELKDKMLSDIAEARREKV